MANVLPPACSYCSRTLKVDDAEEPVCWAGWPFQPSITPPLGSPDLEPKPSRRLRVDHELTSLVDVQKQAEAVSLALKVGVPGVYSKLVSMITIKDRCPGSPHCFDGPAMVTFKIAFDLRSRRFAPLHAQFARIGRDDLIAAFGSHIARLFAEQANDRLLEMVDIQRQERSERVWTKCVARDARVGQPVVVIVEAWRDGSHGRRGEERRGI